MKNVCKSTQNIETQQLKQFPCPIFQMVESSSRNVKFFGFSCDLIVWLFFPKSSIWLTRPWDFPKCDLWSHLASRWRSCSCSPVTEWNCGILIGDVTWWNRLHNAAAIKNVFVSSFQLSASASTMNRFNKNIWWWGMQSDKKKKVVVFRSTTYEQQQS